MKFFFRNQKFTLFLIIIILTITFVNPALAATTQLHIVKYANDGTTILSEKTLTWQEMESSLPVAGRWANPLLSSGTGFYR